MQTNIKIMELQMATRKFSLVVDYFGDKYVGKQHAYNIIHQTYCTVDVDCTGGLYYGIKLDQKYHKKEVLTSP